jgi:hypothetical protein
MGTHIFFDPFLGADRRAVLENMLGKVDFRRRCAVLDLGDVCWGICAHSGRGIYDIYGLRLIIFVDALLITLPSISRAGLEQAP